MKEVSFSGKSALIADDDDVLRSTLGRLLRHLDMEVADAADGAEAVRAVEQRNFDLVISDLSMPQADGFAVPKSGDPLPGLWRRNGAERCAGQQTP